MILCLTLLLDVWELRKVSNMVIILVFNSQIAPGEVSSVSCVWEVMRGHWLLVSVCSCGVCLCTVCIIVPYWHVAIINGW